MERKVGLRTSVQSLAHGRFEDPEHADVFVIMHAEDFVKVYSGEVGVSAISRMVFRGRISVGAAVYYEGLRFATMI